MASEPKDPSKALRESAAGGDPSALDALLQRYLPGLEGYLARRAGAWLPAKESRSDLAQSVCREVLERIAEERLVFLGEAEFKQWLYQAALFKLQNRGRYYGAQKRDIGREHRLESGRDPSAGGGEGAPATPSGAVMRREEIERLEAALEQLSEADREIIRLAHLEGLPHAAIAERIGIEESHSRTRLARALAKLARTYRPESP